MELDRYDWALLNALRADGRISWIKLAEMVNLSPSATQRRAQALQEAGVIRHYSLVPDYPALGYIVQAFVRVKIDRHSADAAKEFRNAILRYSEVESCHKISGNSDFLLHVVASDLPQFAQFLENKILYLPGVNDATSSIVLESIKEAGRPV
jgi:Lrp/AsnC family leucine-responsive transcriptional regulator